MVSGMQLFLYLFAACARARIQHAHAQLCGRPIHGARSRDSENTRQLACGMTCVPRKRLAHLVYLVLQMAGIHKRYEVRAGAVLYYLPVAMCGVY